MLELSIQDAGETIGSAILYYSVKFVKTIPNEPKTLSVQFRKLLPRLNKDTPYLINKFLPYGSHTLEFKNTEIIINYNKLGNPKDYGNYKGYHSEIKLLC